MMGGGLMMGTGQSAKVVEPELDMNRRSGQRIPPKLFRLWDFLHLLAPGGRLTVSPMRSVARELEEAWPARDH
jgi:hypothetical protein